MKHTKLLTALLLGWGLMGAVVASDIQPLNSIAFEANGSIITKGDIARHASMMKLLGGGNQDIPTEQLFELSKQQLLERMLLVYAAKMQGLKVDSTEVDDEVARRANEAGVSVEQIYQQTAALGWSKDLYRREVAKDLLAERILAKTEEEVKIDDGDVERYIAQARQSGQALPTGAPYAVHKIRRIVLNLKPNVGNGAIKKRMDFVVQALNQGHDFRELAKKISQDAYAGNGGELEAIAREQPIKVENALKNLAPQQMSAPIQTASNWQIIQLLSTRTENDPVKMQKQAIRDQLLQQGRQKAQAELLQQLQQLVNVREY